MKTKKNYLIAMCALAISAVSCVDDSVSPQVEAIRAQQVEFMKAKTVGELAVAEFKKAEAALQNGLAAVQNAMAAKTEQETAFNKENSVWTLKIAELNYKVAEANQKALLKNAETALVTAESNLAIAMVAMKTAAAESANAEAMIYYTNYEAEVLKLTGNGIVDGLYKKQIAKESAIAGKKLLLVTQTGVLQKFLEKEKINLSQNTALLNTQKAALTSLNGVIADPSSVETEINKLTLANTKFNESKDKLNNDLATAVNNEKIAKAVWDKGQTIINEMNTLQVTLDATNASIVAQGRTITDKTKIQADAISDLTAKKAVLLNLEAVFTEKTDFYNSRVALHVTAKTALAEALSTLNLRKAEKTTAQLKLNEDPSNVPLSTALTAANNAEIAAQTAYNTALAKYNTATTNMNLAKDKFDIAKTDVKTANDNIETAQQAITTNDKALYNLNKALSEDKAEVVKLTSQINALTTSYTTSETNRSENYAKYFAATAIKGDINDEISEINAKILLNNDTITSLNTTKGNINTLKGAQIQLAKDILDTEEKIAQNKSNLNTNSEADAKDKLDDEIAQLGKELAILASQIKAVENSALKWSTLLKV